MILMNCNSWKFQIKENSLSLFHIISCPLKKHVHEPQNLLHVLQSTKIHFDVIAITETWIPINVSVIQNTELSNHYFEYDSTESSTGGTLMYVGNHLSYKTCSDLNIYKKYDLEYNQPKNIQYCFWRHLQISIKGGDQIQK